MSKKEINIDQSYLKSTLISFITSFFIVFLLNLNGDIIYTPGLNEAGYRGFLGTVVHINYPDLASASFETYKELSNKKYELVFLVTLHDYKLIISLFVVLLALIVFFRKYKININ